MFIVRVGYLAFVWFSLKVEVDQCYGFVPSSNKTKSSLFDNALKVRNTKSNLCKPLIKHKNFGLNRTLNRNSTNNAHLNKYANPFEEWNHASTKAEPRVCDLQRTKRFDQLTNDSISFYDEFEFDEKAREDGFKVTKAEQNPYSVLLEITFDEEEKDSICTGSLLTPEWTITAAHCVVFSNEKIGKAKLLFVYVMAGSNSIAELESKIENLTFPGSEEIQLLKSMPDGIFPHPKYSEEIEGPYDVALIKTAGAFNLTRTVNVIKLTTQPWPYHGYKECKVTGFGKVKTVDDSKDDFTRKTHILDVKQPCKCAYSMKSFLGRKAFKVTICSKNKEDYGICGGDSGSGLVCDNKLQAVASATYFQNWYTCQMSFSSFYTDGCGSENAISLFVQICPHLRWLNSHLAIMNDSQIQCVDADHGRTGSTAQPWLVLALGFIQYYVLLPGFM